MTGMSNTDPYTRGAADAYYGRRPKPHKWRDPDQPRDVIYDLTDEEKAAYWRGYEEEPCGRKDWG